MIGLDTRIKWRGKKELLFFCIVNPKSNEFETEKLSENLTGHAPWATFI